MKKLDIILLLLSGSVLLQFALGIDQAVLTKQSKEHHKTHHELIKENHRLNEWYQTWSINNDCDTFRQPTSVSVECDKYEI